jgi:hypothetical protein
VSAPETPANTDAKAGRFAQFRAATDRVPTKWFAGILTAIFLGVTAVFGGLATAADDPISQLDVGASHTTDQLTIEVEDVVVVTDLPEFSLDLEPGHRAVVVLAHVTNEWTQPQRATTADGLGDTLRISIPGVEDEPPIEIARVDDSLTTPVLQPDLRVPLAFIWSVPTVDVADGDPVEVSIFDESLYTASVVSAGRWWDFPTLAATVATSVTDIDIGGDGGGDSDSGDGEDPS